MRALEDDLFPSTPGKVKIERAGGAMNRQLHRCFASTSTMFLWALFLVAMTASYLSFQSFVDTSSKYFTASWGGLHWERQIRASAAPRRPPGSAHGAGMSVLVTGASGFVGAHCALALRKRGDGVVGIDNFNAYYDPSLKKARKALLASHGVYVVEGDINDARLLAKLFDVVPFTHVLHLAAQAGVRYAMENPGSYVHSNVAGLVTLLEACKNADPQPALVWASSSSVYGLNDKVPFSESHRTDQPASLYAATKKAGEEITHSYNHIYGLSVTGLRFFTVYGPWGRPDMAYFSFTRNILQGKPITVYRGKNHVDLARDFTYIDDIVKGCLGSLDTAGKSTGTGGKKRSPAPYRIFNLGQHLPGHRTHPRGHPREAPPRQGQEARGGDARQRRRAIHPRQHLPRQAAARVQAHHQPRRRTQEVRQMVPLILRLHQGIQELVTAGRFLPLPMLLIL